MGVLILRAAAQRVSHYKERLTYCDNLGIVRHAGKPNKPLPENQSQGGIINLLKQYITQLDFDVPYHRVNAYLDEVIRWDQLTEIQKLNVKCDTLAKEVLLNGIVDQEFIPSCFPFEDIVLNYGVERRWDHLPLQSTSGGGTTLHVRYFIARELPTSQISI